MSTALLGTDRRPVPAFSAETWAQGAEAEPDPATAVLAVAARRRAAVRAGRTLASAPPRPVAPLRERSAGPEAQTLLARLLAPPSSLHVTAWLRAAATRGVTASPEHWTSLAALAARDTSVDRIALSRALGARGRWFVAQNPRWARLAASLEAPAPPAGARPSAPSDTAPPGAVPRGMPADDPWAWLRLPAPWPAEMLDAAVEALASGRLGPRGPAYAAALAAHVPDDQAERARAGLLRHLDALPGRFGDVGSVGELFAWALDLRLAIGLAFATDEVMS